MALRKFRELVQDRQRPVSIRLEPNVLEEETDDRDITDATTVIIGSELSASERKRLTDDLLIDIRKMSKRGDTIIAMAAALESGYDRDFR
jgi:hypothetical protein